MTPPANPRVAHLQQLLASKYPLRAKHAGTPLASQLRADCQALEAELATLVPPTPHGAPAPLFQ